MSMIEVYVENSGRQDFAGEWLKLPTTRQEVQRLLSHIGVDGERYTDISILDFESNVSGLASRLSDYENLDELNYLAVLLDELKTGGQLEKFEAALSLGEYSGGVRAAINLAQNLDCYDYFPGVENHEQLGEYLIYERDFLQIPEEIRPYFDYEAYGRDYDLNSTGSLQKDRFNKNNREGFIEYYTGREDIPDEHKVFAYPEREVSHSILKTLKQFRETASTEQSAPERPKAAHVER